MMEKIKITPIALKLQEPTDFRECFLELWDTHLKYKIDFTANEATDKDDPGMPWDLIRTDLELTILRSSFVAVEMSLLASEKLYTIGIICNWVADDLKIYFKRKSDALDLYIKLENYLKGC